MRTGTPIFLTILILLANVSAVKFSMRGSLKSMNPSDEDKEKVEKTKDSLKEIQSHFQQIFEYGAYLSESKEEELSLDKVLEKAETTLDTLLKKFGEIYESLSKEIDLSPGKYGHSEESGGAITILKEPNMDKFNEDLFKISSVIAYLSFSIIDTNNDHSISLEELLAIHHGSQKDLVTNNRSKTLQDRELKQWFQAYDVDKSGGLDIEEFTFMTYDFNQSTFDDYFQEIKELVLDNQFKSKTSEVAKPVDPDTLLGEDSGMPPLTSYF